MVMNKDILLIFARNPTLGKVKTRLAATIGNVQALLVYKKLVAYTASVTENVDATKTVYYSEFIGSGDGWDDTYLKAVQQGRDLGDRMSNAFIDALGRSHPKAIVIGTDCYGLTTEIISDAFRQLDNYDVVIGPARDGGYYLLGIRKHDQHLFDDIAWSTNTVLKETLSRCLDLELTHYLLPTLADIDDEKDLAETDLLDSL
jgi:uncharacterized protein